MLQLSIENKNKKTMTDPNRKYITIEGKEYPFTMAEFKKILKIIKKTFVNTEEEIERENEIKQMDDLLKQLN